LTLGVGDLAAVTIAVVHVIARAWIIPAIVPAKRIAAVAVTNVTAITAVRISTIAVAAIWVAAVTVAVIAVADAKAAVGAVRVTEAIGATAKDEAARYRQSGEANF
jgi:hypothetical protein